MPDLTIEPWGRIEGTLRVGGKPVAHEIVEATLDEERIGPWQPSIQNESRAQTDDRGRFVIERVTPGEARVHWQSQFPGARTAPDRFYQPAFVDILPGQTIRLDLVQEGGRSLIGRITVPQDDQPPIEPAQRNAYLVMKVPEVPYPPGLPQGEQREWLSRWRTTEAARLYRHRRRSFGHSLKLQPDGSFRVDEIQPGEYELHVIVKGFPQLIQPVIVSNPITGQSDVPVNLGVIAVKR